MWGPHHQLQQRVACFPFPFPHDPIGGKRETPLGSGIAPVAFSASADAAGGEELGEDIGDVAGAHPGDIAELALGEGSCAVGQNLFDALKRGGLDPITGPNRVVLDDGESEGRWIRA